MMRESIIQTAYHQRTCTRCVIVQNGDANAVQCCMRLRCIAPMIVIAQHREGAQPASQAMKRRNRLTQGKSGDCELFVAYKISCDQDDIGSLGVYLPDDPAQPFRRHVRPRHVDIRQQKDAELFLRAPRWKKLNFGMADNRIGKGCPVGEANQAAANQRR